MGSGAQAKDKKPTRVDAQFMPRLSYICVVKSGKAAKDHEARARGCNVDIPIPARQRTTTLPARTLRVVSYDDLHLP